MYKKILVLSVILSLFLASCNLPLGGAVSDVQQPDPASVPGADVIGTSVELTAAVRVTDIAASAVPPTLAFTDTPVPTSTDTPIPTACTPMVTATTDANVRSGPDVAYDVVGSLSLGGTAVVAGRNDANTWWYIEYASVSGGHAWISGSVATSSCLPAVVQLVAAPPLPTLPPATNTPLVIILPPPVAGVPDLVASAYQYSPQPAIKNQTAYIMVTVTNSGTAPAGSFTVSWFSNQTTPGCDWTVQGLGVGKSKNLECQFTYNKTNSGYWVSFTVDSGNQIAESNESNNSRDWKWQVVP